MTPRRLGGPTAKEPLSCLSARLQFRFRCARWPIFGCGVSAASVVADRGGRGRTRPTDDPLQPMEHIDVRAWTSELESEAYAFLRHRAQRGSNGGESRAETDIARLRTETVAHSAAPATARIGSPCGDRVGLSWLALVCQKGTFTECLRNVSGWARRSSRHVTVNPTGSLG